MLADPNTQGLDLAKRLGIPTENLQGFIISVQPNEPVTVRAGYYVGADVLDSLFTVVDGLTTKKE